jgi:hypothetical protein
MRRLTCPVSAALPPIRRIAAGNCRNLSHAYPLPLYPLRALSVHRQAQSGHRAGVPHLWPFAERT